MHRLSLVRMLAKVLFSTAIRALCKCCVLITVTAGCYSHPSISIENRSQSRLNGYVQIPSITPSARLPGLIYHPKPASRISLDLPQGETRRFTHQGEVSHVEYYGPTMFVAIIRSDNTWLLVEIDGSSRSRNRISFDRDEFGFPFVAYTELPELNQKIIERDELFKLMRSDRTPEIMFEADQSRNRQQDPAVN